MISAGPRIVVACVAWLISTGTCMRLKDVRTVRGDINASSEAMVGFPESPVHYKGALKYHIADMKVAVSTEHKYHNPGNEINLGNCEDMLNKLVDDAAINGLRMPMIPLHEDPSAYPDEAVHTAVYQHAKKRNLVIFASLMPDTKKGWVDIASWSDDRFVNFVVSYVEHFKYIQFLGPWNEPYLAKKPGVMQRLVPKIRAKLAAAGFDGIKLVGPDEVKISGTEQTLKKNKGSAKLFDIIGTHSQKEDVGGTVQGWQNLIKLAGGKPVWNTEGMTVTYTDGNPCSSPTKYKWCPAGSYRPPMKTAVDAGVEAWVQWGTTGKTGLVYAKTGEVTERAKQIAAAIVDTGA